MAASVVVISAVAADVQKADKEEADVEKADTAKAAISAVAADVQKADPEEADVEKADTAKAAISAVGMEPALGPGQIQWGHERSTIVAVHRLRQAALSYMGASVAPRLLFVVVGQVREARRRHVEIRRKVLKHILRRRRRLEGRCRRLCRWVGDLSLGARREAGFEKRLLRIGLWLSYRWSFGSVRLSACNSISSLI